jgi:hypothetical protein
MILPPPGFKQPIPDPSQALLDLRAKREMREKVQDWLETRERRMFVGTMVLHDDNDPTGIYDVRDPALQLASKEPKCST